jgi:hypothetical protein
VTALARVSIEGEPSYLSSSGTGGLTLFCHVTLLRSGALDVVTAVTSRDELAQVGREETSRSKLRAQFEVYTKQFGVRMAPAPAEYVAWRIARAAEAHGAAGRAPLAEGATRTLAGLTYSDHAPSHPAKAIAAPDDAQRRVVRSLELLAEPELHAWLPPPAGVERVMKRAGALIEPAGADREAAVLAALHAAIDEFYTPDERAALSTQLRDAALMFAASRRPERALDAVAVADAVDAAGEGGATMHAVPLVFGLFYKFARAARRQPA